MKTATYKVVIPAISIAVIFSIIGCEEENLSETRRHRLIADENMQLKRQLEKSQQEIERQKELVVKCEQEKKEIGETLENMGAETLNDFEEKIKLQEENKKLQSQIEKLRKRLE